MEGNRLQFSFHFLSSKGHTKKVKTVFLLFFFEMILLLALWLFAAFCSELRNPQPIMQTHCTNKSKMPVIEFPFHFRCSFYQFFCSRWAFAYSKHELISNGNRCFFQYVYVSVCNLRIIQNSISTPIYLSMAYITVCF